MSDILCVINRKLCIGDFERRLSEIVRAAPRGIILREKDLTEQEYKRLGERVMWLCHKHGVPCILHSFPGAAIELKARRIHMPLPLLRKMDKSQKKHFMELGASCHSEQDAVEAQKLGCTYITVGHIFDTDCKKGASGRGISLIKKACEAVNIPVYAIGGINSGNYNEVKQAGAAGACVMSGLMQCADPKEYLKRFREDEGYDI